MSESTLQSQPQKRPASPIAGVDYPPKFESVTEEPPRAQTQTDGSTTTVWAPRI